MINWVKIGEKTKTFGFILLMFLTTTVLAETEISANVKINSATVFLKGARLNFSASANVPSGKSIVILKGLPQRFDANSLSVNVDGNATLLSVLPRASSRKSNEDVRAGQLEDSVKFLKNEVKWLHQLKSNLDLEEQVLSENKKLGGTANGFTIVSLKELMDFYRTKTLEIKTKNFELDAKIEKANTQLSLLQVQLNEISSRNRPNVTELEIQLISKSSGVNYFSIDVLVHEARWEPLYEIRSMSSMKEVNLGLRANIFQTTGQNWENIKLVLSTSQNNVRGNRMPVLSPSFARVFVPRPIANYKEAGISESRSSAPREMESARDGIEDAEISSKSKISYQVNNSSTALATEYEIVLSQSIFSGSRANQVPIEDMKLPANFSYRSIPKLDKAVYLVGGITSWGNYNLVAADASVFLENNYVGKTYIDPNAVTDTLYVPFGTDTRLNIQRVRLTDYTKRKVLGSTITETFGFEITYKNNNAVPIEVVIEDQIPLSTGSDVEITVEKADGAQYDKEIGKLTWKIEAKPGQSKKVNFVFTIKYPKEKNLQIN